MLKKNIAKMPDAARNIATFAVSSERIRKIESRTSGAFARISITTKATSSAAASPKNPSVFAEPQPADWASTMA